MYTSHGGNYISSAGGAELVFIEDIVNKNKYLNILKQNFIKSVTTMTHLSFIRIMILSISDIECKNI